MKKLFIWIHFAFCLSVSSFCLAQEIQPNILLIVSDDAGYSDLGSFGGEIETPNLDALAANGLKLSRFYSNARCSPTRASLLTGVEAAHVGFGGGVVGDWERELPFPAHRARLKYEQPLISELLLDSDYQTMMVGKWHLGGSYIKQHQEEMAPKWKAVHPPPMALTAQEMELDYLALPPQRGFEKSFVFHGAQGNLFYQPDLPHPYYHNNEPAELKYKQQYDMRCYSDTDYSRKHYSACDGKKGIAFYATDGITDEAISMLKQTTIKDKPFFMYVAYRAPHKPLQAPKELVDKYKKKYSDLTGIAKGRHKRLVSLRMFPKEAKARDTNAFYSNMPPEKYTQYVEKASFHAAMMEKLDDNVGRLVSQLKEAGQLDNTLIVYLSDNGAASHIGDLMNQPYAGVKALLWEGGARTHAILHWPNTIQPGSLSNDIVWVGDLFSTFIELSGVEFPQIFRGNTPRQPDGRSIVPLLKGKQLPPPIALYNNDKGQQSVLYKGKWKLLIEPGWYLQTLAKPGVAIELYDIENDPGEVNNVADMHPELVKRLTTMAEEWKSRNKIIDYRHIIKIKPNDPY